MKQTSKLCDLRASAVSPSSEDCRSEENIPRIRRVRREKNFMKQTSELCELRASVVRLSLNWEQHDF